MKCRPPAGRSPLSLGLALVAKCDTGRDRQPLHGLGERQVLELLEEGEDRPSLAAAMAMEQLLGGTDGERGSLLRVEGAKAREVVSAGLLELKIAGHDPDDVRALPHDLDVL